MDLLAETLRLRARYDEEPSHSDHVTVLALQLFDEHPWHGLEGRSRELLRVGSLLHDIGWSQVADGEGHHKWSARLIRQHDWKYLKKQEVEIVAQIARYHRKSLPKPSHAEFEALPEELRHRVMILGGMVRIADALDRTHTGRITKLEVKNAPEAMTLRVFPKGNWEAEQSMFEAKKEMLERAAQKSIRCEAVDPHREKTPPKRQSRPAA